MSSHRSFSNDSILRQLDVDYISMKDSIKAFIIGSITAFMLFSLFGCAGSPANISETITEPVEEDVFTLMEKGEIDKAREMFRGTADAKSADPKGRTALHFAAEKGDADFASFLIKEGAAVDARDAQGRTPLQIACESAFETCVAVLVDAGADIFQSTSAGKRIVDYFFSDERLLRAIANEKNLSKHDTSGRTLLHEAAVRGDLDATSIILSKKPDINKKDIAGKTALDLALDHLDSLSHMKTAALLIQSNTEHARTPADYFISAVKSADLNSRFEEGYTGAHISAAQGHTGILEYLVEQKANINARGNAGSTPLHEAIRTGHIKEASILLAAGADINAKDSNGNTALHVVIPINARQSGIDLLLSKKIELNAKDNHGDTALHIIVGANQGTNILSALLKAGAEVNTRNIEGKTPLHRAVEKERPEYIQMLLLNGADIFAVDKAKSTPFDTALKKGGEVLAALITDSTVKRSDNTGNTQLHIAVSANASVATLDSILEKNGLVNARNNEGNTALHIAVRANAKAAGEFLLKKGADVLAMNSNGESPLRIAAAGELGWILTPETFSARDVQGNSILHYTAAWNLPQYVPYIIETAKVADSINTAEETALFPAVRADSPRMIKTLIDNGVPVERRDSTGNTLLHAAVRWNAQKSIRALLEAGFDLNARNAAGKTALHDAVRLGLREAEEILTTAGADIDAYDNNGATPLIEAVAGGNALSVERLLEMGASLNWRNSSGDTALHIAVRNATSGIITILLSRGASINTQNAEGETPFSLALESGKDLTTMLLTKDRLNIADERGDTPLHKAIQEKASLEVIATILELGAFPSTFNSSGQTPLHIALKQERMDAATLLMESGADIYAAMGSIEAPIIWAFKLPGDKFAAAISAESARKKDKSGNSLLHYAASKAPSDIIRIILGYNAADRSAKNGMGLTPLDIARRWNRSEEIQKLLSGE